MNLRTVVDIPRAPFSIFPCEQMLFVGSCFATNMGQRCRADKFRATVNPFGVMYNPVSVRHTIERSPQAMPQTVVLTLGTNRVYVLKETGEVVDNCEKRPQSLFHERELSLDTCFEELRKAVLFLLERNPHVHVIITVSPLRYAKYGFPASNRAKAVLLLAAHALCEAFPKVVHYFPAYEIMNDELRDYRFYQPDMIHPTEQAVDYIWERFADTFFADETHRFIAEWRKIAKVFRHRPFHPEAEAYQRLLHDTRARAEALARQYPGLELEAGERLTAEE